MALAQNLPDLRTVALALIAEQTVRVDVVSDTESQTTSLGTSLHDAHRRQFAAPAPDAGALARQAKVIVRTGAFEPWGNIGLYCGVDAPHWFGGEDIITPPEYASRL
ncbi:D-ribose pyranase OS=Streptomyces rutgersensis OX=53451 GN=rbsD PE=4 SV=1 [Streptomyces diastaticus subsp. diastaticus]